MDRIYIDCLKYFCWGSFSGDEINIIIRNLNSLWWSWNEMGMLISTALVPTTLVLLLCFIFREDKNHLI